MKKTKKCTGKLKLNFPEITILKALKYKYFLGFQACLKTTVEFNDLTYTIC